MPERIGDLSVCWLPEALGSGKLCLLVSKGASLGWPETPRLVGSQTSIQPGVGLGRQDLVQKQVGMAWLAAGCLRSL